MILEGWVAQRRGGRGEREEGGVPDLQECVPHLHLLPSPLRGLRVHLQAAVVNQQGERTVFKQRNCFYN